MENIEEVWFPIPGYEGIYELSNLDRIKCLSKVVFIKGKYPSVSKEKIIKGYKIKKGYIRYTLRKNGLIKSMEIHVIKACVFLGHTPCGHLKVVDHIDNDPTNNSLNNLQIITNRENSSKDRKSNSGYTGVYFCRKSNKWKAKIVVKNKAIHLGYFENEINAHNSYKEALIAINADKEIKVNKPIFSSQFKGVHWHKIANKWQARIYLNGKMKHLGLFDKEVDARVAIDKFSG